MTNATVLQQGLLTLRDRRQGQDRRHLKTAVHMMVGLILSSSISLSRWIPSTISRAWQAQSVQRRVARWLDTDRLDVHRRQAPLSQEALTAWGEATWSLALETTMRWNHYCMSRLRGIDRGRAVPLAWQVIAHRRAPVAFRLQRDFLLGGAQGLPSCPRQLVWWADRGFAEVALMRVCQPLGWRYRWRIKSRFLVYRPGHGSARVDPLLPKRQGQAVFLQAGSLPGKEYGPVHLALARPPGEEEPWLIVSDQLTGPPTVKADGWRFDMEENLLEANATGVQLEDSKLRSAAAIERLLFAIAAAPLYLVVHGSEGVAQGRRREVDPDWVRGSRDLKLGWPWIKPALHKGWPWITCWRLQGGEDPDPARASRRQDEACQQKFKQYK